MSKSETTGHSIEYDDAAPTAAIREQREELRAIAEELIEAVGPVRLPPNQIRARIEGNVRPSIRLEFDARGQSQIRVLSEARHLGLFVRDIWQLHRQLPDERPADDQRETVINVRLLRGEN